MDMEIPFLKNKQKNQGASGPAEVIREGESPSMLRHVTRELLSAIHTKDEAALEDALKAFILNVDDDSEEMPS